MPKIPQNMLIKSNPKSKTQREEKNLRWSRNFLSFFTHCSRNCFLPLQIHSGTLALENEIDGSTKVRIDMKCYLYADLLTYGGLYRDLHAYS